MLRIVATAIALAGFSASAQSAEAISVPLDSTGRSMPVSDAPTDWSGFYAGVYGVSQPGEAVGGVGVTAGVSAQIDFILVGAEVSLQGLTGEAVDTAYGSILGRTGLVLNDDALLYAAAGYGWDLAGGESNLLAGGGVEIAVNDQLSLNAQYLRGFDQAGDGAIDQFSLGARFHF